MEALLMHESTLCSGCGQPRGIEACVVEQEVCNGCRALDITQRKLQDKHSKEKPKPDGSTFFDGRKFWVRKAAEDEMRKPKRVRRSADK